MADIIAPNSQPSIDNQELPDFATPMMQQYLDIKKQYQDCLLLYRLGDFYELFLEDAKIGAKILDIVLTSRTRGKDGRIPMAGVPYHALDSYLAKLIKAGYKVAICDQIEEPDGKNLVKREVIRIVTPGTVLDEKSLDQKQNNYLMAVSLDQSILGLAICDLSTGEFQTGQFKLKSLNQESEWLKIIQQQLAQKKIREVILPEDLYTQVQLIKLLKTYPQVVVFQITQPPANKQICDLLSQQFHNFSAYQWPANNHTSALKASYCLIKYLQETQKQKLSHLQILQPLTQTEYLELDQATIENLELFNTVKNRQRQGSLIQLLDETQTAMGGRMFRNWLTKPLKKISLIKQRQQAVALLVDQALLREQLIANLAQINDLERLCTRLVMNLGNPKDLIALRQSLHYTAKIRQILIPLEQTLLHQLQENLAPQLDQLTQLLTETIVDEPPFDPKQGGFIKTGIDQNLDTLLSTLQNNKQWLLDFEQQERQKTGINSLKVRFNKVFGFYIEISKANLDKAPANYDRKQTLVNAERFTTPELKAHEEIILTAQEKSAQLEYQIFLHTIEKIVSQLELIHQASQSLAQLDCLSTFAQLAQKYDYHQPNLHSGYELEISNGRHPVVEKILADEAFVPNSVKLDKNQQLLVITGPNMAGKSVLIRQVALIVLLAQIGSFVPADQAKIGIVDQIFVRSGASDAISAGLSTFMVEMTETAHILNNATDKSLIIMDEIGRGTSTYDGISLAWAIAQYLVQTPGKQAKTLFATHYHELQALADKFPQQIKNFSMQIATYQDEPVFLHKFMAGGASHSFGVAVAKLAGVPSAVTILANQLLKKLESQNLAQNHLQQIKGKNQPEKKQGLTQLAQIKTQLQQLDLDQLTPLEAMQQLADLQKLLQ